MKSFLQALLALISLWLLPQCAKELAEIVPEKTVTVVGRVSSVSPDKKIILIEKFTPGSLPDDVIYSSRGSDGQTASLLPTGERIRHFHAADLVSGSATVGDAVYARRIEEAAPSSDLADPAEKTTEQAPNELPQP